MAADATQLVTVALRSGLQATMSTSLHTLELTIVVASTTAPLAARNIQRQQGHQISPSLLAVNATREASATNTIIEAQHGVASYRSRVSDDAMAADGAGRQFHGHRNHRRRGRFTGSDGKYLLC